MSLIPWKGSEMETLQSETSRIFIATCMQEIGAAIKGHPAGVLHDLERHEAQRLREIPESLCADAAHFLVTAFHTLEMIATRRTIIHEFWICGFVHV